jgi:hypothetical protein
MEKQGRWKISPASDSAVGTMKTSTDTLMQKPNDDEYRRKKTE